MANGFAAITGSSRKRLTGHRSWTMPPLRSIAFRRLHCYYGRLRPCAPHRYLHPYGGLPLGLFSWHRSDRFSRSTPEPDSDSRHLYAERHPASKQVSAGLYPGPAFHPGFDATGKAHDTSSAVHLRSSSRIAPAALSARRLPDAHHDGSLPTQLGVVWSLVLQPDSEGPTLISNVVGERHVTAARARDARRPSLFLGSRAPSPAS